jgi:hypothetical protein
MARVLHRSPRMLNRTDELKDRVEAQKLKLGARLAELKADTRHEAIELRDGLQKKLHEVESYLKDGWDKLSDGAKSKLNEWLDRD